MKKMIAVLLMASLCVMMSACSKESQTNRLVVGSEQFNGYFLPSEGFTNTMSDETIRTLLHDGSTIALNEDGELFVNETTIHKLDRREEANGDVTYTIELSDLLWSDGTKITSDDYLFALLLAASPEYANAGAIDAMGEGLVGYYEYFDGNTATFQGIKRISDTSFSLRIDHEELPYFWELMYISVNPYPMHVLIHEGEAIQSNEAGTYFDGNMKEAVERFTSEYNTTQSPSCGPYTLTSYESGQVRLTRNEAYAGDAFGHKPVIDEIIVKEVNSETAMDALINHEIDLLEPVMDQAFIDKGNEAVKDGALQRIDYSRNGYGVLSFKTDQAPTNEVEVRRAIAYLIDRNQLLKDVLGSYGEVIDSDYVPSQWMAKEAGELALPYTYHQSIEQANKELNASSYRFEADGVTPYDANKAGREYLRYNKDKEPLIIRHLTMDGTQIADVLEAQLMEHCAKAGIEYTMERSDEAGLQEAYYYASEQNLTQPYQMFTLGSEYASIPDPYYASLACEYANTSANPSNFCDVHMDEVMNRLRHTSQANTKEFLTAWKAYISYYNEVLPQLPLYTSTYAGFANANLQGYHPTTYLSWADQVSQLSWR